MEDIHVSRHNNAREACNAGLNACNKSRKLHYQIMRSCASNITSKKIAHVQFFINYKYKKYFNLITHNCQHFVAELYDYLDL